MGVDTEKEMVIELWNELDNPFKWPADSFYLSFTQIFSLKNNLIIMWSLLRKANILLSILYSHAPNKIRIMWTFGQALWVEACICMA